MNGAAAFDALGGTQSVYQRVYKQHDREQRNISGKSSAYNAATASVYSYADTETSNGSCNHSSTSRRIFKERSRSKQKRIVLPSIAEILSMIAPLNNDTDVLKLLCASNLLMTACMVWVTISR